MNNINIKYLDKYYLTLKNLALQTNISETEILKMMEYKCIPRYSYKIEAKKILTSYFGTFEIENEETLYFSYAIISWIKGVIELKKLLSYEEIAKIQEKNFEKEFVNAIYKYNGKYYGFEEAFNNENKIIDSVVQTLINEEWKYILDGTYGLCTQTSNAEGIVRKHITIQKIIRITEDGNKNSLTSNEKNDLIEAIKEFNNIATEFAPIEREKSSRYLRIDKIVEKYNLQNEISIYQYEDLLESKI